jgi:hypothetical protein
MTLTWLSLLPNFYLVYAAGALDRIFSILWLPHGNYGHQKVLTIY